VTPILPHFAIAIDGPAASGKSTLARLLAQRLGLIMVNSGAMYRAITWKVLQENVDPKDSRRVIALLESIEIHCGNDGTFSTITINGVDPGDALRAEVINANVSIIAAIPEVRHKLIDLQRAYLEHSSVVMEGRDIGSVVFPNTRYKIYVDAAEDVRAARRVDMGEADSIAQRDAADSKRVTAPLVVAQGAAILDNSYLSIEAGVTAALNILYHQGLEIADPMIGQATSALPMKGVYWFGWMTFRAIARSLFGVRIIGAENLVTRGPVLVAANHQSYLDPPLISTLYDSEMFYLARKTLFTRITRWLYSQWNAMPIDQDHPDMASLKSIIRKLKNGHRVLVFPEGARSHDGELGEPAPGIGLIAVKSGAVIQPIRISGAREALPRGSSRVRFTRITVAIGTPIRLTSTELKSSHGKEDYNRITQRIMAAIAAL
jgi:cytidylate kinase